MLAPYNMSIIHQKHMSFNNEPKRTLLESKSLNDKESWKRFYKLIIKDKKSDMRKFLTQLNK